MDGGSNCPACGVPIEGTATSCFGCGHVLVASPLSLTRGRVIASRYEVIDRLGEGGMGLVFKAHDRVLDTSVALKVLRPDAAREPEVARRFLSEIKLARRVHHRNVCAIHEYGEADGLRFISMEFVDGVNLRQVIGDRGALPTDQAYRVVVQAAEGLCAIHRAGVIHRDLKSANVMIDRENLVRLMDFGIAKRWGSDTTAGGGVVGTPEYMSPEQARGRKVDFRSDVYALGILTYEVFTGRVPFHGDTQVATILLQLSEPPPLEGPMAEGLPPALVPVLRKALAKSAAERHGSAGELLAELRRCQCSGRPGGSGEGAPARREPDVATPWPVAAEPTGVSVDGVEPWSDTAESPTRTAIGLLTHAGPLARRSAARRARQVGARQRWPLLGSSSWSDSDRGVAPRSRRRAARPSRRRRPGVVLRGFRHRRRRAPRSTRPRPLFQGDQTPGPRRSRVHGRPSRCHSQPPPRRRPLPEHGLVRPPRCRGRHRCPRRRVRTRPLLRPSPRCRDRRRRGQSRLHDRAMSSCLRARATSGRALRSGHRLRWCVRAIWSNSARA
jgi:serine/threonine protein kinase